MRLTARERQQLGRAVGRQWGLIRGNTLRALERKGLIESTSLGWRVTPLGHRTHAAPLGFEAARCTGEKSPAWDAAWLRREMEALRVAALASQRRNEADARRAIDPVVKAHDDGLAMADAVYVKALRRILKGESLVDELRRKIRSFK